MDIGDQAPRFRVEIKRNAEKQEFGMNMEAMAKILIGIGLFIILAGIMLYALARLGVYGVKIPGDIYIKRENFSFYFPIVSCLVISLLLTLIINLIGRR